MNSSPDFPQFLCDDIPDRGVLRGCRRCLFVENLCVTIQPAFKFGFVGGLKRCVLRLASFVCPLTASRSSPRGGALERRQNTCRKRRFFGFVGESAWLPCPCIQIWGRGPKNPFLYAPHCQISWSINAFFESFRGQAPFSKGACGGQGQSPSCSRAPRAPTDKPKFEGFRNRL